jgi:hypothetical protein
VVVWNLMGRKDQDETALEPALGGSEEISKVNARSNCGI